MSTSTSRRIRDTATVDAEETVDVSALPWPVAAAWASRLAGSPLVAVGEDDAASDRPLRLVEDKVYLDRYWREERGVAADIAALAASPHEGVDDRVLAAGLTRVFAAQPDGRQTLACASAVLRRLAVVAGGPGTGKTTTVARIVALLAEQAAAAGSPPPLVALAAPTGKAAARLEEAVHEEAAGLDVAGAIRAQLLDLKASTLHRLLGWRPDSRSRFRHNRGNRLPHDVVIVDETSMVSLSLMARLVEAVRPEARLVLVGDPGQLTSIEAGAVLGDVVGPASEGPLMGSAARTRLAAVTGLEVPAGQPPAGATVGDGIVVLNRVHRYGGGIAAVAEDIRRGDADAVLETLASAPDGRDLDRSATSRRRTRRRRRPSATAPSPPAVRCSRRRERVTRAAPSTRSPPSASCARTAAERTACRRGRSTSSAGSPRRSRTSAPRAAGTPGARCW